MRTLLLILFCLSGIFAWSATQTRAGENVTIDGIVDGDLYVAGGKIIVNGKIKGDLIGAGGDIFLRDSIFEDLVAAGGNLYVEGPVLDDIRMAGGKIFIRKDVRGDVIVAGGDVVVEPGVTIEGDLFVAAGKVRLDGTVKGTIDIRGDEIFFAGVALDKVSIKGRSVELNGEIQGPGELVGREIRLGTKARFYQDIQYYSGEGELDWGNSLVENAKAEFDESMENQLGELDWEKIFGFSLVAFILFRILTGLLFIALLILIFHQFWKSTVFYVEENGMKALGYGLLYFFITPVVAAIAIMLLIGIPIGFFILSIYGFSLMASHALASVLSAYWIENRQGQNWSKGMLILIALGIFLLIKIITMVPILGWLLSMIIFALVFGKLIMEFLQRREEKATSV